MKQAVSPRVVLVHDWLTGMRGGEKCLEVLCRHWPTAQLFTLLHNMGSVSSDIERLRPRTSFLQRLPYARRYYRHLLPLMPYAVNWRLPACDLVLSLSHCVAKAVRPPAGTPHICYCFTPMRYAWHMREAYFGNRFGSLKALLIDRLLSRIREWDRRTSERVSHFVAISRTVQERIKECYDRDSIVIHPPVDTDFYTPSFIPRDDYYLVISAFAPYKRIDLAITACAKLGRRLVIIGNGQDSARLRASAGPDVLFLGWQPNEVIRDYLRGCRALLFPGEEDFGIVPVEANACGTPVIAFGKGGATETILPLDRSSNPSGVWFMEQTVDSLIDAMQRFEEAEEAFCPHSIRKQSLNFDRQRFESRIIAYAHEVMKPAARTRLQSAA